MELRLAAVLVVAFVGFASAGPRRGPAVAAPAAEQHLIDLLKHVCTDVTEEVKHEAPARFTDLVHSLKSMPHATLTKVHRQVRGQELCSSTKLVDLWNDALIMDASEGSLKLVAEQIIRKEVSAARANYLLTMMALSRRPTAGAIRAVLPILDEKHVPRQALLGISALIRNVRVSGQQPQELHKAVQAIAKYMANNSQQPDRVIAALKALQNIGTISQALDQVIRLTSDSSQKSGVRVAAIEALQGMASEQQVRSKCQKLFENSREDAEIRIAAYKVLVESGDHKTIQKILETMRKENEDQGE